MVIIKRKNKQTSDLQSPKPTVILLYLTLLQSCEVIVSFSLWLNQLLEKRLQAHLSVTRENTFLITEHLFDNSINLQWTSKPLSRPAKLTQAQPERERERGRTKGGLEGEDVKEGCTERRNLPADVGTERSSVSHLSGLLTLNPKLAHLSPRCWTWDLLTPHALLLGRRRQLPNMPNEPP